MGFCDLNSLTKSSKKHRLSQGHIHAMMKLKTFGRERIDFIIDNQNQRSVEMHDKKVKENREVMRRLIGSVYFVAK